MASLASVCSLFGMGFSPAVKEQAMVACGRHCCICHRFCGIKIECNHIQPKANGGGNTFANCIPLCFDCHAEVGHYNETHPKGTKYSPQEQRMHRDAWYKRIATYGTVVSSVDTLQADREVFKQLRALAPEREIRHLLKDHDWSQPISAQDLELLGRVRRGLADLSAAFLDPVCEGMRSSFQIAFEKFRASSEFGQISPVYSNSNLFGVPKEWRDRANGERREYFFKVVDYLNQHADKAYAEYASMIQQLRKLLSVP